MKLFIFGATGFLGSTLFSFAEKLKLQVLGTSRYINKNQNIIKLDVTDKQGLKNAMESFNPDAVAWTLLSRDHEDVLLDFGLTNLLSVIKEETKLIFLSTDAIFSGTTGGYKEGDEPVLLHPQSPLTNYINAKIRAERKITAGHRNHIIIRTGPLYGRDVHGNIEARTQKIIREIEGKGYAEAAADLYKTFVHIDNISIAILEIAFSDFVGKIHVGPANKESYYSFYQKRLNSLGIDSKNIEPINIGDEMENYIPMDTSLNTQKASTILKVSFKSVRF